MLALHGQGRIDLIPAGDLGYLKLVGRLSTGNPRARADEDEVRDFFAPLRRVAGPGRRVPAPRRRDRPQSSPDASLVEPLARQELVGQRRALALGPLEQLVARASTARRPPTRAGPGSRRAAPRPRGRRPAASRAIAAACSSRSRSVVGLQQRVDARLRVARARSACPRAVARRKRRRRDAALAVEIVRGGRRRSARCRSARRAAPSRRIRGLRLRRSSSTPS